LAGLIGTLASAAEGKTADVRGFLESDSTEVLASQASQKLLTATAVRSEDSSAYSTAVNWHAFLAQHNMHFEQLPSGWQEIEFHELRTDGAFLVSAKRHAGRTEWVRIKSLAGEPCRGRTDLAGEVSAQGTRQFKLREVSPPCMTSISDAARKFCCVQSAGMVKCQAQPLAARL